MNFFGHAWVALRDESNRGPVRAEFVLGAMLPDFASMLRTRPPSVSQSALQAGIAFHHLTDEAFHGARSFLEFSRHASRFLSERGLSRGSARAVAHVGVELLLDAAFGAEPSANEAYLSAIGSGLTREVASHIHWQDEDGEARFRQLCHNLERRGAFVSDAPASLTAERLRYILADRPRLAMDDAGQSVVREWIETARPAIVSGAAALLSEVEHRIANRNSLER